MRIKIRKLKRESAVKKKEIKKTGILLNTLNIETSILMTYFNKQNEIKLILEAFLLQTVEKEFFEIIIVDDGSEISIQNDVNVYKEKGLNITLIEKKSQWKPSFE